MEREATSPPATHVAPRVRVHRKSLAGFLRSLLDRGWPCRQEPQGERIRAGGNFRQPPSEDDLVGEAAAQLLVWQNNRVQYEHLGGDPDAAACSVGKGTRGRPWGGEARGKELGATAIREGSLPAHLCPGLMPPVTHTGPGIEQTLGKCLLKE